MSDSKEDLWLLFICSVEDRMLSKKALGFNPLWPFLCCIRDWELHFSYCWLSYRQLSCQHGSMCFQSLAQLSALHAENWCVEKGLLDVFVLLSQKEFWIPGRQDFAWMVFTKGTVPFKAPLQPNNQKLSKDRKDTCIL